VQAIEHGNPMGFLLLKQMLDLRGLGASAVDAAILASVVPPLTSVFQEVSETCFGARSIL
jgi:pantothenate kinase type III